MKKIRYTFNAGLAPWTPDGHPEIRHGDWSSLPSGATLLPPCSPSKIVCVGRNYVEHAKELGNEVPSEPLIFLKPLTSLLGSGGAILYPPLSKRVDFEGELGLVISKRGRNIQAADAWDYVEGFTCVNDVTARDLQKKDGQWTRGKGFDTFCAVGPCLAPRDEVDFPGLRVRTLVNGDVKQDGSVKDMIFSVADILEYVSAFMTLEAGDLIATGTPPGVGPVEPGASVCVSIDGIGSLENSVVQG